MKIVYLVALLVTSFFSIPVGYAQEFKWSEAQDASLMPCQGGCAIAYNGQLYSFCGNSVQVCDPGVRQWRTITTSGSHASIFAMSSAVLDGHAFFSGGTGPNSRLQTYNFADSSWDTSTAILPSGGERARLVTVGSTLYMIGAQYSRSVYSYDVSADTWSIAAADVLPPFASSTTSAPAAVVVGNRIYIFGGDTILDQTQYQSIKGVWVFDVTSNAVSNYALDAFVPSIRLDGVAANQKVYLIAWDGGIQVFDPETRLLTRFVPAGQHTERDMYELAAIGNSVFELGGNGVGNLVSVLNFQNAAVAGSSSHRDIVDVWPSPCSDHLSIDIESGEQHTLAVTVIDQLGRYVGRKGRGEYRLHEGQNQIDLDLADLIPSTYHLVLRDSKGLRTFNIVKK